MLAKSVIDAVDDLLQDEDGTRWPRTQRLRWLNEGQLAIVSVRPDAKAAMLDVTLVAGVMQTIPATAIRLLDVPRNKNGRGITLVSREVMTDLNTHWYTAASSKVIKHFAHDPRIPKEFDVFPQAAVGAVVQARCSIVPTDCATENSNMDLDDTYKPALVNWICHRAFARDAEAPASQMRSQGFFDAFRLLLTGKTVSDQANTPAEAQPNRVRPNTQ